MFGSWLFEWRCMGGMVLRFIKYYKNIGFYIESEFGDWDDRKKICKFLKGFWFVWFVVWLGNIVWEIWY